MKPHKFTRARTRPRSQPGIMNKTEQAYAEVLEERRMLGQINGWRYESIRFKLAGNTHYTPDFWVQLADGTIELHEVKACRANGAARSVIKREKRPPKTQPVIEDLNVSQRLLNPHAK